MDGYTHARTHAQTRYLGVAVDGAGLLGVGVAHTDSELHVGYAFCSVDPQFSYTPRLMQSASEVPSKADLQLATLSTFHAAMFALNADAESNACEPTTRGPTDGNVHTCARAHASAVLPHTSQVASINRPSAFV